MDSKGKVTVIGSGLIGRCWSVMFAKAGYSVCMYYVHEHQLSGAMEATAKTLVQFEEQGLLSDCHIHDATSASKMITTSSNMQEAMEGAIYLQECAPENLDLKKNIFTELDKYATDYIVLASSTSCIGPSKFTLDLVHKAQCIVSHPVNPPYHLKLVEVIPSPETRADVAERTVAIMKDIGQSPVLVRKEVNGFALNRLQYAVLMEAWRLVEDGVLTPEDIDTVFKDGLAPRWSLIGPFETIHLNAPKGVNDYCERYGANIENVCQEQCNVRTFGGATGDAIHQAICATVPVDQLPARCVWRDEQLGALSAHRREQATKEEVKKDGA